MARTVFSYHDRDPHYACDWREDGRQERRREEAREVALAEGEAIGEARGEAETRAQYNVLVAKLASEGRIDDAYHRSQ